MASPAMRPPEFQSDLRLWTRVFPGIDGTGTDNGKQRNRITLASETQKMEK